MSDPVIRFLVIDRGMHFGPFTSSLEAFIWAEKRRESVHDNDKFGTALESFTIAEVREPRK